MHALHLPEAREVDGRHLVLLGGAERLVHAIAWYDVVPDETGSWPPRTPGGRRPDEMKRMGEGSCVVGVSRVTTRKP